MIITYLGQSSFKLKFSTATLITDPFGSETGLHFTKQEADIVTISHSHLDHNFKAGIKNYDCFFIEQAGEYEIKEVMIRGLKTYHDDQLGIVKGSNIIYLIQAESLTICHLGDLGHEPSEKLMKEIESTDILMISAGGTNLNHEISRKIIHKIEPSIILPMHYKLPQHSQTFAGLGELSEFANKIGLGISHDEKLTIKDGGLPEETLMYQLEIRG